MNKDEKFASLFIKGEVWISTNAVKAIMLETDFSRLTGPETATALYATMILIEKETIKKISNDMLDSLGD